MKRKLYQFASESTGWKWWWRLEIWDASGTHLVAIESRSASLLMRPTAGEVSHVS
jgi:hypothetical protein